MCVRCLKRSAPATVITINGIMIHKRITATNSITEVVKEMEIALILGTN